MSKDLKNVINTVEKESKSNAELEQKIQSLKEEIKRQNLLIENLRSQMKNEEIEKAELPSEIDILKDIVTSQRQELDKKDTTIAKLDDKIFELTSGSESNENINSQHIKSEDLLGAQKMLVQLTDENEQYKNQIELLQAQIEDIQSGNIETEDFIENDVESEVNEALINFKRLNFQLMEQNGLLRVEVESLKAKLHERIDIAGSEELKLANDKINILTSEIEDFEAQIKYLQERLEKASEPVIVSTEDALQFANLREEFDETKTELLKVQKENQNLNQMLNELKEKKIRVEQRTDLELPNIIISTEDALQFANLREELDDAKTELLKVQKENQNLNQLLNELKEKKIRVEQRTDLKLPNVKILPKRMQQSLFFRMYNLLDDFNKAKVINYLIQDLKNRNYQVRRNAIKILSVLKNKKIYDAFLEMINDKDWIVRYSIIKALSKFEDKNNELKSLFQRFSRDVDVDVRELALKILNDFPK